MLQQQWAFGMPASWSTQDKASYYTSAGKPTRLAVINKRQQRRGAKLPQLTVQKLVWLLFSRREVYATGNHVCKVLGYGGEHLADSVFKLFRMFVNILILQFIIPLNLGLFQYSAPSKHGLMPRFFCINSSAFCLRLFFSCKTGVIERFIGVSASHWWHRTKALVTLPNIVILKLTRVERISVLTGRF